MTRRWKDYKSLMSMIKLFMIDEVHMLAEERGATLEVIVSRMKTVNKDVSSAKMRLIAISATVPNIGDVAEWLRDVRDGSLAVVKVFGEGICN